MSSSTRRVRPTNFLCDESRAAIAAIASHIRAESHLITSPHLVSSHLSHRCQLQRPAPLVRTRIQSNRIQSNPIARTTSDMTRHRVFASRPAALPAGCPAAGALCGKLISVMSARIRCRRGGRRALPGPFVEAHRPEENTGTAQDARKRTARPNGRTPLQIAALT